MYTKQEVFSKVYTALYKQAGPSFDFLHESCRYLSNVPSSQPGVSIVRKCAVGHLLTPEVTRASLEGRVVGNKVVNTVLCDLGYGEHLDLLSDLQAMHDDTALDLAAESETETPEAFDAEWFKKWRKEMVVYAVNNNLQIPMVE